MAVRAKAWFCGCLTAGIAGSNLSEDMDDSLFRVLQVAASPTS